MVGDKSWRRERCLTLREEHHRDFRKEDMLPHPNQARGPRELIRPCSFTWRAWRHDSIHQENSRVLRADGETQMARSPSPRLRWKNTPEFRHWLIAKQGTRGEHGYHSFDGNAPQYPPRIRHGMRAISCVHSGDAGFPYCPTGLH
jgi:hypothetical protein